MPRDSEDLFQINSLAVGHYRRRHGSPVVATLGRHGDVTSGRCIWSQSSDYAIYVTTRMRQYQSTQAQNKKQAPRHQAGDTKTQFRRGHGFLWSAPQEERLERGSRHFLMRGDVTTNWRRGQSVPSGPPFITWGQREAVAAGSCRQLWAAEAGACVSSCSAASGAAAGPR